MSKKKNTLKDLDAFLKQQAATLVAPDPLSTKITPPKTAPEPAPAAEPEPQEQLSVVAEAPAAQPVATPVVTAPVAAAVQPQEQEITPDKILSDLNRLAEREGANFRKTFYDLIIRSLETRPQSLPEDKMLINTALYLKSGDQWKDVIRQYWEKHR